MKTQCCIIVVSIAKLLSVVLQMCLQTISSSVLSSDGHLKPACGCNKTNDLILNLTPENVTQHSRIE